MAESIARLTKSTTVWVFPPDIVPYPAVMTPRSLELISEHLGVQPLGTNDKGEVILGGGSVALDDGSAVIESMTLGPRRLVLCVLGTAEVFAQVADKVAVALVAADARQPSPFRLDAAIVDRTESVIVKNLAFSWERIFAEEFVAYLKSDLVPRLSDDLADAEIAGFNLGFEIKYTKRADPDISNVQLSPKKVALETRAGSTIEDRLYWCSMPVDTNGHGELLERLVRAMTDETTSSDKRRRTTRKS